MASRDVSFVTSASGKRTVQVQSSRRTTTMTSSSGQGETVTSKTSEYNVRQIGTGPGGQVLDCKVERVEQSGQPRVEMVFSVDPLQQQPSITPPVVTVYCFSLTISLRAGVERRAVE